MSLSKIQEPLEISPVNNPIPIVYGSSFSTQLGFRYKVELLDSGNTVATEIWIYPDTDNSSYCIYDFSMLLGDLVNSNKENWNKTGFTESWESFYPFNYTITEYIGSTSGATETGSGYNTFRGVQQYEDTWAGNSYIMRTGTTSKFLSNKTERKYKLDEYASINAFFGNLGTYPSTYNKVVIDVYDGDFLVRYNYPNQLLTGHIKGIFTLPIGPKQINDMAALGYIYTGATSSVSVGGAILDTDDIWYEIHLQYNDEIFSETIRIYLDHNCYKHDGVEFLYLGELSTYETYTARYGDEKKYKTDKSEIKSSWYDINATQYSYNFGDRGRSIVNVRTNEEHSVYTDWIKDEVALDIMELFRSPDVYIIKNDKIYPVIITNGSYIEKTVRNDRLFNYKIDYIMAYEKLSNI